MRVERELMRGAGPVAVLKLLEGEPKYGYELVEALARGSDGVLDMGQSTLYPLLYNLEARGLVRREPDPSDGRFTNAILTDEGFRTLADAAPGHVAHVRSLVIDVLSPEQLRRLGLVADRIMSRIDTSGIN